MPTSAETPATQAADPFRPSAHTGLLIAAVRAGGASARWEAGLDMGTGSGAVLAVLGQVGVRHLVGVDIDPAAIEATAAMLRSQGLEDRSLLFTGSLWEPLGSRRFDVVASNLPQFAADEPADPEHSPYWSTAGSDGREFMDPFLAGLADHLQPDGVAYITHNVFLGRDKTAALLRRSGMACRPILATSVILHERKARVLNPLLRAMGEAAGIHRVGRYDFIDVEVLEIRRAAQG